MRRKEHCGFNRISWGNYGDFGYDDASNSVGGFEGDRTNEKMDKTR